MRDCSRNLGNGSSVSQLAVASHGANPKMPTNYTSNEFVLIMLHQPSARTISVLVTTHKRVGRTMSRAHRHKETAMNTGFNQQGSARIYQFPVGGRAGLGGHRQ